MVIAVVDDDAEILDSISLVLELHRWRVLTYTTGEAFLADLERVQPDCLILDPHLPGLNGADIARSIVSENRNIPIIGLTARPYGPVVAEVENAGALVMLTKPVTEEVLIDHVRVALRKG